MNADILLLVADFRELSDTLFGEGLDVAEETDVLGITIKTMSINNQTVLIAKCGTGILNAYNCCSIILDIIPVKMVINAGMAGSSRKKVKDMVISKMAYCYGDMIPDTREEISNEIIKQYLEIKMSHSPSNLTSGTIVSSEKFICDKYDQDMVQLFDCVDMEAYGIYISCKERGISCIFLKCISDDASENAVQQVNENITEIAHTISNELESLINFILTMTTI